LEVNGELVPRPILVTRHPFTYTNSLYCVAYIHQLCWWHKKLDARKKNLYSRGWKFVYLVLKYTPFYSVLAGSVSLSQEKGVVICSHFSLLTYTPLPPLYLTLPLFNITNYFTAMRQTVKQPLYGT
jgi:hypothetical protein